MANNVNLDQRLCSVYSNLHCLLQIFSGIYVELKLIQLSRLAKLLDRAYYFQPKCCDISLFLNKNVCCGYSLEAPCQGASNVYHNISFHVEIRKVFIWIPLLSRALTLCMLGKKFSRRHFEIFFLFFLENRI